ncbi:MAG TPA: helix-turn-helix domain-containing protein [Stellaceae bacterium]|jgi:predicted transcriptional regulator/DNA-binding XRE family transcriptional regulator|nr:helix-turn-helix domain-containing protein [Stellaceae bacterium]
MGVKGKVFEAKIGVAAVGGTNVGNRLRELRQLAGMTQAELAHLLNTDQTAVSRLEKREDIRISTLRGYIEALGARLRIDATFNDRSALVRHFEEASLQYDYKDENQLILPILDDEHLPIARDIVFSIKPEHSQKIEQGLKTVELRRRFPVTIPSGTAALIYSTTPIRALTGIAEIATVLKYSPDRIWEEFAPEACINKEDFNSYFAGTEAGFVIKLRHARSLRRPLYLDELRQRFNFEPPQSFLYAPPQLREALTYECAEVPH